MLSPEEALLFRAVQEEQKNQEAQQNALMVGGVGGGLLGAAAMSPVHNIGKAVNNLRGVAPTRLKSRSSSRVSLRGLVGLVLGGGLGAGMAAAMKSNDAGEMLGRIQAKGGELSMQYAPRAARQHSVRHLLQILRMMRCGTRREPQV